MLLADPAGAPRAAAGHAGCLGCGQAQRTVRAAAWDANPFRDWAACIALQRDARFPRWTCLLLQEHPWFQTALPGSLTSVDEYNAHYVELSKAPDLLVSRESIKSVMQVTHSDNTHIKLAAVSLVHMNAFHATHCSLSSVQP